MFSFLLIVQTLVAATLVGVILMQRSEGGGLGVGGSSSGFMTARGAADFLMAAIAGATREPTKIDTSLANTAMPVEQSKPVPAPAQPPAQQPQQNQNAPAIPLAQ
jgi:preprotein translocase subunit SecG